MSQEMSDESRKVVEKVAKLLRLAANNPNQAEAASATARAQELLAAYNLDMAAVSESGDTDGKRAKEMLDGGRFKWERDLWGSVASLNFCMHFCHQVFIETPLGKIENWSREKQDYVRGIQKWQHKVVGRAVNVSATKHMASYLQDVAKRLTREACATRRIPVTSAWARSFTEGVIDQVCIKIFDERQDRLNEESKRLHEARKNAAQAAASGNHSDSTAVTLASYSKSEHDANIDFVYGEGTAAGWAAERAKRAAAQKAAEEEYTRWAAANPKEAAREERKREKELERLAKKRERESYYKGNWGAYSSGLEAGRSVSIHQQAEGRSKPSGLLK